MVKNYVIDTNVLIHDPNCIYKFDDNILFIPIIVLEELDKFKSERSERGYNARRAIRNLVDLRDSKDEDSGIRLDNGGKIYIGADGDLDSHLPKGWDRTKNDNRIISYALSVASEYDMKTVLVTNDAAMLLKADCLSSKEDYQFTVEEYKNDRVSHDYEIYSGRSIRYVSDDIINDFTESKQIKLPESDAFNDIQINEFINLKSGSGSSVLCKYDGEKLVYLFNSKECPHPYGLQTRNLGQTFLQEALLSSYETHPLTIVNGPAGTGKTLFALGCGLEQVTEKNLYKRIFYTRANVTMDEEIGFLPGTEREKIDPLLRGAYDNLEILLGNKDDSKDDMQSKIDFLFGKGIIVAESLAYLRGRSITDTFIIIDEAQNCTPNQILSIVTRIGEGSKIVLMGDVNQIDNVRLDSRNNGLIYALERMKGSKLCEICSFDESECTRSPLAKEASDRLKKR